MAITRFRTSTILQGTPKYENLAGNAPQSPATPVIGTATDVGTGRPYNNGAATVTFTPTGTYATNFVGTSSPGGFTGSSSSSPLTVTGLLSNTAYQFTVYGENSVGASGYSSLSNSVTATTVPQAPTIGSATAGNAQATVTFTAGATGGKAVSSYTATSSPGGVTGSAASSPITVTGLTNGTAYTFTVTATNANGTSAASAASNSVTPAVPTAFESIATIAGSGSSITFSNIPQTYSSLQIRAINKDTSSSTFDQGFIIRINGSSSSIYVNHSVEGTGSAIVASSSYSSGYSTWIISNKGGASSNASYASVYSGVLIDFHDYTSTTRNKTIRAFAGTTTNTTAGDGVIVLSGMYAATNAITSITILSSSGFASGTSFALYGIKGA